MALIKNCLQCGDEFTVHPSLSKQNFCSIKCYHLYYKNERAKITELICTICKIKKPISEFYQSRKKCKKCLYERRKELYRNNPALRLANSRKYYHSHKKQIAIRAKKYYEENRDKIVAKAKIWLEKNRERRTYSAYHKAYYEKNKRKIREDHKRYFEKNRARLKEEKRQKDVIGLSDQYIINLLRSLHKDLKKSDIPQELIQLKRYHVQLKREVKNGSRNKNTERPSSASL